MIKQKIAALVVTGTGVVLSVMGLAGVAAATTYAQPPAKVGVATNTPLPVSVKTAKFVNQYGTPETLGSLKGKTVFLVPLLTLCGDTCPFTSGNLLQLQSTIDAAKASNVEIVSIDVDPYRDTEARIAAYAS